MADTTEMIRSNPNYWLTGKGKTQMKKLIPVVFRNAPASAITEDAVKNIAKELGHIAVNFGPESSDDNIGHAFLVGDF